jgi:hypothetical protein
VAAQVWSTDFLERKDLVDEPALGLLQSSNCCGARVTAQMTPPHMEPSKQPTNTETKFSKMRPALAFAIAGISDAHRRFCHPFAADCVGCGSRNSVATIHGAGPAMAAVAGTGFGGDSGLGGASILAVGSWSDCCPGHSSADV